MFFCIHLKSLLKLYLNSKTKFDLLAADITVALRELNNNAKDMSINTAVKGAASIGAIFGTAQFLTAEDDKLLATAKGVGLGAGIYAAARLLSKQFSNTSKAFDEAALLGESSLDAAKLIVVKTNSITKPAL